MYMHSQILAAKGTQGKALPWAFYLVFQPFFGNLYTKDGRITHKGNAVDGNLLVLTVL